MKSNLNLTGLQLDQTQTVRMEISTLSDRGRVREKNEDSLSVVEIQQTRLTNVGTLAVLADGMGGRLAGEVASNFVTSQFPDRFRKYLGLGIEAALLRASFDVNEDLLRVSSETIGTQGMGSTLVGCFVTQREFYVVNIGDSRAYICSNRELRQVSKDDVFHSEEYELFGGESPDKFSYVLTQAMGASAKIVPNISRHAISLGDALLLCSDGLTNKVENSEMVEIISALSVREATNRLVALATERGGEDNISVVLMKLSS